MDIEHQEGENRQAEHSIEGKELYWFAYQLIDARMYVLCSGSRALVIDPNPMPQGLGFLQSRGITDCLVLLTHEHYDHIAGVNLLREHFPCRVLCSKACAQRIADPKGNAAAHFSALFIRAPETEALLVEQMVDKEYRCAADDTFCASAAFVWEGLPIRIDEVPGHSPGGQVIHIGSRAVFTGDALIPGLKTITRLPGGSRRAFREQAVPYLSALPEDCVIFPGHGEPAPFWDERTRCGIREENGL